MVDPESHALTHARHRSSFRRRLLSSETVRYSIAVRTELAARLPRIMGDRVQLQQVMMNLMTNGIDAMKDVDGARELTIKSRRADDEQLVVCVSDTGVGLPPQHADQIFYAFFTTCAVIDFISTPSSPPACPAKTSRQSMKRMSEPLVG